MDDLLVDGRADVASIMERIRAQVRSRREAAVDQGRAGEAARLRLQHFIDDADIDPELTARILAPGSGWNISADYRVETHRQGIARRLVLLLKGLARPVVRLYTDQVLDRQAQINRYLVHLSRRLLEELIRLEASERALTTRCDGLEARLLALEAARVRDPAGTPPK